MRRIFGFTFSDAKCLTDAHPPRGKSGVYALLVKTSEGSKGTVRYFGSSTNIGERLNWGHEIAKQLAREYGKGNVLCCWYVHNNIKLAQKMEEKLIAHFGSRLVNSNKKAK